MYKIGWFIFGILLIIVNYLALTSMDSSTPSNVKYLTYVHFAAGAVLMWYGANNLNNAAWSQ